MVTVGGGRDVEVSGEEVCCVIGSVLGARRAVSPRATANAVYAIEVVLRPGREGVCRRGVMVLVLL